MSRRTQAAIADVVRRLHLIRCLWLTVHNDPDKTIEDQAVEFFYKIGEILEGKSAVDLEFNRINRKRFLNHLNEV